MVVGLLHEDVHSADLQNQVNKAAKLSHEANLHMNFQVQYFWEAQDLKSLPGSGASKSFPPD